MSGTTSTSLHNKIETILKVWRERALEEVPSASTAESLALRDSLPLYLEHLSEALATNRKMDVRSVLVHDRESVRIGKLHGQDRAGTPNYVLTEVISEYAILRQVIFQVLEREGPLNTIQRDIIYDSIEQAVNDAAVKFSEVHADIQQKFINTLTHDLKTPITAAKVSAQLIMRCSEKPDDCARTASRIVGNMNRLDSMISDLLDVSLIRAGEPLSLQLGDCDLGGVVHDVVEEFNYNQENRIRFIAKSPVVGVLGCEGLRRAAENLIGNAIKYGSDSTPIIVSLERTHEGLRLTVHNSGTPIPQDEQELLFQQYRRSKSAFQGNKTGWGLGLALVKGVADAHAGKVFVESTEGMGTTFTLEIPME